MKTDSSTDAAATSASDLRARGLAGPLVWASAQGAAACTHRVIDAFGPDHTEVVKNPHRWAEWARGATSAEPLLAAVQAVIGPDVAIENSFLMIKWPGGFEVPWHQDGTDARIELDPDRSVSAWLALTNATTFSGCLQVAPRSHRLGYLPCGVEEQHGAGRGRAGQAAGFSCDHPVAVPVAAGHAVLMDVRLLHRSGINFTTAARIGLNVRYVAPGAARTRDHTSADLDPISGTGW